jgi:hypothetical protein
MPEVLRYPGDVTNFDPDHMLEPDLHGRRLIIKSMTYDEGTNTSTATLRAVLADEFRQRVETFGLHQARERSRIGRLFNG